MCLKYVQKLTVKSVYAYKVFRKVDGKYMPIFQLAKHDKYKVGPTYSAGVKYGTKEEFERDYYYPASFHAFVTRSTAREFRQQVTVSDNSGWSVIDPFAQYVIKKVKLSGVVHKGYGLYVKCYAGTKMEILGGRT